MTSQLPSVSEYPTSMAAYVMAAPQGDILAVLRNQRNEVMELLSNLPESMGGHRYAPGKWSIRELVGHMNDAERIFEHRAFRFSHGDATPLPGFDEDAYVAASSYDLRTLADLLEEFGHIRSASISLFQHLSPEAWGRKGIANGKEVSVRALAFVIAGHTAHHLQVFRERYLG